MQVPLRYSDEGNTFYALRHQHNAAPIQETISETIPMAYKGWVLEGGNLVFINNTWGQRR